MDFFGLQRKTVPSMNKRSREIRGLRSKLCKQTLGDTVMDCLEDLKAHGVEKISDADKRIDKKGQRTFCDVQNPERYSEENTPKVAEKGGNVGELRKRKAAKPLVESSSYHRVKPVKTRNRATKRIVFPFLLPILVVIILVLIFSFRRFRGFRAPQMCPVEMLKPGLSKALESIKSDNQQRGSLVKSLLQFGEEVIYDWSDNKI